MRLNSTLTAAVLALTALALPSMTDAGTPAGTYQVAGTNPGGDGDYEGTVTVTSTGETYAVKWDIAGATMAGTGVAYMGAETTLSVAFDNGDSYGVAQFTEQPDGTWFGSWVFAGGQTQGIESWARQ